MRTMLYNKNTLFIEQLNQSDRNTTTLKNNPTSARWVVFKIPKAGKRRSQHLTIFYYQHFSTKIKPHLSEGFYIIRHRASFPHSSIIAADELDFCVRNDYRYFLIAMDTETRLRHFGLIYRHQWVKVLFRQPLFSFCK